MPNENGREKLLLRKICDTFFPSTHPLFFLQIPHDRFNRFTLAKPYLTPSTYIHWQLNIYSEETIKTNLSPFLFHVYIYFSSSLSLYSRSSHDSLHDSREKWWKLSLTEELQRFVKRCVQTEFAFCIIQECVSRDMAGVHKRAWTKWRGPLCPMGVWQWTSALRIVTGLTNVFREGYHGCLASQWLGQHRLIIFYSTLCVLRHAAYVTRPWNYNYWTSAAYILENSSFAPHRSLNANKAELSLRYMSPFPRLPVPLSPV